MDTLTCVRCEYEWFRRSNGKPLKCPRCGQRWDVPRRWTKHPRVLVTCFTCGLDFMRKQSHIDMGYAHHFCSRECSWAYTRKLFTGEGGPAWNGDNVGRPAGRQRARRLYSSRPCEVCSATRAERHHRDGNTLNNDPSNIAFLCHKHHFALHDFGHRPHRYLKAHCLRGHPYDDANTRIARNGVRVCRACKALHQRHYNELRKAGTIAKRIEG